MTEEKISNVKGLRFRPLDIEGRASIYNDLKDDEAFGIYAYEFTDGTWYIGKSQDVRARHVEHMHEYRHKNPPLVPKQMLWAPVKGDARQLDYAETDAISWFEEHGYSLQNVLKTGRPRGNTEVIVDTGEGWGVPIPWSRQELPQSGRSFSFDEDPRKLEQWKHLQRHPAYEQIIGILRWYVSQTIPAPADTAGRLWVITALPSTKGDSRFCTLSCQNTETLVICKEGTFGHEMPHGFVNVKRSESGELPGPWWRRGLASYGTLKDCYSLYFHNLDDMKRELQKELVLDCCYRVNAELMRRGPSMYKKANNPYLVCDIVG